MLIAQLGGIPSLAVTAVSLVALGATLATSARSREHATTRVMLATHLCVYASLYLLFIGAICDAAFRGPQPGLTALQWTDFGLSAAIMAVVAQTCVARIIRGRDAHAK
jgi:hypothetical protein